MATGLYQGLNEAYQSYRGRQQDITAEEQAKFNMSEARKRATREDEQYEYGVTRRPSQERASKLALDTGELQLKQQQITYKEFVANTAHRATQNHLALKKAKLDAQTSGLMFNDAEISLRAKKGAEKYNGWTREWLQGMSMEELVEKFNTDDDDSNNIKSVTGNAEKGWEVTFENDRTMSFADRDQVAIHIQSMADPNFHQTYLLQMESQKASLAAKIAKAAAKSPDTLSKEKTTWENMTRQQVKDYFTESIKESIVSLGSEGSRDIAGDVRAVVDRIGFASTYGMINSDVTRVANQMAKTMLVKEPAERKKMAEEYLDAQRKTGAIIPKPGDDGYELILNRQMAEDYDRAYDQFTRAVYTKFFRLGEDGAIISKDYKAIADFARDPSEPPPTDTISAAGLERPAEDDVPGPSEDRMFDDEAPERNRATTADAAASEDALGLPTRSDPLPPEEIPKMGGDFGGDAARLAQQTEALVERSIKHVKKTKTERTQKAESKKWGSDRAAKIGVRLMGAWKKADKAKIKKDFTNNFKVLTLREKKDWLVAFARGLDKITRKIANDIVKASTR